MKMTADPSNRCKSTKACHKHKFLMLRSEQLTLNSLLKLSRKKIINDSR